MTFLLIKSMLQRIRDRREEHILTEQLDACAEARRDIEAAYLGDHPITPSQIASNEEIEEGKCLPDEKPMLSNPIEIIRNIWHEAQDGEFDTGFETFRKMAIDALSFDPSNGGRWRV